MNEQNLKIKLRPAKAQDSGFAYDLKKAALGDYVKQTWGGWDEDFQRQFHRQHWDPTVTIMVTTDDGEIGTMAIRNTGGVVWLESLYLMPDYHNRGIGSKLVQKVIDQAGHNQQPLRLKVLKVNPASRLYKRLGFKIIEETETHLVMERRGDR